MRDLEQLLGIVRNMLDRAIETERRVGGIEFRGVVAEVDGARHAVKLVVGQTPEGEDVLSPWIPVAQTAGKMKFHDLPSVGQQGVARSASGDIEQSSFTPLHWSDANPSISDDPNAKIMEFGAVTVSWDDQSFRVGVGESFIELTGAGIRLSGTLIATDGGSLTHNQVNVGSTHVHGGVRSGASETNAPS